MTNCERIPLKTESIAFSGKQEKVDCMGLCATVYADGTDILIKAHPAVNDEDAFVLKNGGMITFGGCFYVKAESGNARIIYCKTL